MGINELGRTGDKQMLGNRFEVLMNYAEEMGMYIQYSEGYAEPGYPDGPVVLANWNDTGHYDKESGQYIKDDTRPSRLAKLFEKLGCNVDWSDEYCTCETCGKAFRTTGDSYGWQMYGHIGDGFCQCGDCVKEDPSEYLAEKEGRDNRAVTIDLDLESHGYHRVNVDEDGSCESFENGLYGGQCDDPRKVAESLRKLGIERFIFTIDSVGQFDLDFSVWVHCEALGLTEEQNWDILYPLLKAVRDGIESRGDDPAEAMKSALADASRKMAELKGPGVRYAKCKDDGTAEVRLVSPEEFINGIKD